MKLARTKLAAEIARRMDGSKPVASEVAAFLIDTGSTSELSSLLRDVQELRAQNGIVEVTASSAYPLTADEKHDVETAVRTQYPHAQKVIIHQHHDQGVVGGISLAFANADLDLTIRAKLNKLRALTA